MDLVHLISFQALFIFCHLVNECAFSIFSLVKVTWAVMNREPTLEASFKTFLLCVCVHWQSPPTQTALRCTFRAIYMALLCQKNNNEKEKLITSQLMIKMLKYLEI